MIETVLFDLDGTLTDPKEGITKSVDYALRTVCGIETPDLDTLTPYIGPPLVTGFMDNHHLDRATAERCKEAYRERFRTLGLFENRMFPEIPNLLKTLKAQGYRLCVATSKPEIFAVQILEHFALTPYFTLISGASMDETISTKTEVIQNTLQRIGCTNPDTVVMIGDRKHDIEGAHNCGIRAIGVLFGFGSREELQNAQADRIACTIQQIPSIVDTLDDI